MSLDDDPSSAAIAAFSYIRFRVCTRSVTMGANDLARYLKLL